ncbi:hypothetical protein ANRL1_02539 [Anaerolineae bacterium]|nr:hypothetical protein ANRL1_02539 [Anaerolineae bacterium]
MSKWLKIGTLAAVVAMVALMAFGATATFAQGPTQNPPAFGRSLGLYGGGFGGPQNSMVAVAAKVLDMDVNALIAELNSGKTIADVAKAKGVALDKIVNEFVTLRATTLKAAVDAKRITQAQADATLAQIKTQVQTDLTSKYTPRGYGNGAGQGFVDANKDGICDTCGANRSAGQFPGARGRWTR